MDFCKVDALEKHFVTSLKRNFFNKIYQHITQNENFQFTNLENSLIELGHKLPKSPEDVIEYDVYGGISGIRSTYKKDMDVIRSMVIKEISDIYITLDVIINVLRHLRV